MKQNIPKEMFFYETLKQWSNKIFANIIPSAALSEEISIKNKYSGLHEHFWTFTHNKKKYLIKSTQTKKGKFNNIQEYEVTQDFPIKIVKDSKITHYGKVHHVVNNYKSVKIGAQLNHSVKEVVDTIFPLEHENPEMFKIMKLIAFISYVDRLNVRICSGAGFGKDSVFKILNLLMNDVCTINPRSTAAAEYRLTNKVLVLNELSNLSSEQATLMQELILLVGDMSMSYNKSTRGKKNIGSFDTYDISKLSLIILYNNRDYYAKVNQEDKFFDNVFQGAVPDRFLPLRMSGRLNIKQFDSKLNISELLDKYAEEVKKLIKSLMWFKENWNEYQKDRWVEEVPLPNLKGRHYMHYKKILRGIQMYAENQKEYNELCETLKTCHEKYKEQTQNVQVVGSNIKEVDIK